MESSEKNGLPIVTCPSCGLSRQLVDMSPEELSEWYVDVYFSDVYKHNRRMDERVARSRIQHYNLHKSKTSQSILDVGCGLGCLVHELRKRGHAAVGVDLANISTKSFHGLKFYQGLIESHSFPTDHFDVLICKIAFVKLTSI